MPHSWPLATGTNLPEDVFVEPQTDRLSGFGDKLSVAFRTLAKAHAYGFHDLSYNVIFRKAESYHAGDRGNHLLARLEVETAVG